MIGIHSIWETGIASSNRAKVKRLHALQSRVRTWAFLAKHNHRYMYALQSHGLQADTERHNRTQLENHKFPKHTEVSICRGKLRYVSLLASWLHVKSSAQAHFPQRMSALSSGKRNPRFEHRYVPPLQAKLKREPKGIWDLLSAKYSSMSQVLRLTSF